MHNSVLVRKNRLVDQATDTGLFGVISQHLFYGRVAEAERDYEKAVGIVEATIPISIRLEHEVRILLTERKFPEAEALLSEALEARASRHLHLVETAVPLQPAKAAA